MKGMVFRMDLKQLQSFVAVVQYRSFSKAAEKLFISQPTISTHIRMLEEELNYRLIVRTTKSIEVTPHGMELYTCACQMFALRDGLLERWSCENKNQIRLGASTIPTEYLLPEILPEYRKLHPEIQFTIHQNSSSQILLGLLNDDFSLGMVSTREHEHALDFLPIYEDTMVLITPYDNKYRTLLTNPEQIPDTLKNAPIILREQQPGAKKSMEAYLETLGIMENELHVTARLNDQESIIKLVASGLGISLISRKASEQAVKRKDILAIPLSENQRKRTIYLACRKEYIHNKNVTDFLQFASHFYTRSEGS